jgi:hypothetical protein
VIFRASFCTIMMAQLLEIVVGLLEELALIFLLINVCKVRNLNFFNISGVKQSGWGEGRLCPPSQYVPRAFFLVDTSYTKYTSINTTELKSYSLMLYRLTGTSIELNFLIFPKIWPLLTFNLILLEFL